MSVHICKYCGESISEKGNSLSRHPDLCASCSSITDGMGEALTVKASDRAADQAGTEQRLELREAA
jgi:hypothetical protein